MKKVPLDRASRSVRSDTVALHPRGRRHTDAICCASLEHQTIEVKQRLGATPLPKSQENSASSLSFVSTCNLMVCFKEYTLNIYCITTCLDTLEV